MKQYSTDELIEIASKYIGSKKYDRKPERLYAPIEYILSLGGKRIRPVLMLMAYNLYRDDIDTVMEQALALETYHNMTLVHDDVMDNSEMRRGKPTVHKLWNENTAILSGDTMLITAIKLMSSSDKANAGKALDLFLTTMLEIDEGQQMDMDFEERNDVTTPEYIEMIRLKTAVFLASALKIGALLAGAGDDDADTLYHFGEQLGLAFQLQDDYLDVYGDPAVFGKPIGGDIAEGKKTFMLINAYAKANDSQREELDRLLSLDESARAERISAVTALYTELGIDKLSQNLIAEYGNKAMESLNRLSIAEERKQPLIDFAEKMLKRKK